MSVSLSPIFNGWQGFYSNGKPLNAGLIQCYAAGSTTPQATYTTSAGNVACANPIVLAADGRPTTEIWLTDGQSYRFDLTDTLGNLIKTYDNITGGTVSLGVLSASSGSSLVGFIQAGTGAVSRTEQAELREWVKITQYGAVGDGTDQTAAIQLAVNYAANNNRTLLVVDGTFAFTNLTVPSTKPLSILGLSKENSILKQLSASSSATTGIASTGDFHAENVCFDQNWSQTSPAGYDDSVNPATWGGYWLGTITTNGIASFHSCRFANPCRGFLVIGAAHLDFFNNVSDSVTLPSPGQCIIAASGCQEVSMNENQCTATRWTSGNGNGISALFNWNSINLEINDNTLIGHQLVSRGSTGGFTASISATTLTVTALASGVALYPGMVLSGTNVIANNNIVSQLSGTTGSTGTYTLAFTNGTVGSEAMTCYMARATVANNIIDTPIADTAFYGWKNLTVTGNIIRMSGDVGLSLDTSQYYTVTGNTIDGAFTGGIHVGTAYGATVAGNTVKDIAQGGTFPYTLINAYGRYASGSGSLAAIAVDYAGGNQQSVGVNITGNTVYYENFPAVSDANGAIAANVKGIWFQSSTNTSSQSTGSITGNYVEAAYSTVPASIVYVMSHRFYLKATGAISGTPITGDTFSDGAGNSFVLLDQYGNAGLCFIKKLVGTIPTNTTFTGALNGATIISNATGVFLTWLGITGAGNFDWTTTYANQNIGP